jgi:hypothetical protein
MEYQHTQRGWLHWLLYGLMAGTLAVTWFFHDRPSAVLALVVTAMLFGLAALAFHYMTVEDDGEALAVRYGPLPLFRTRIYYIEITSVEPGQTSLIDGWGIHFVPGRGWTYNLWGFGCARLQLGDRVVRIGTDDVDNLVSFLRRKLRSPMA